MKSDRVFLCEWLGDYTDSYNDIPWPMVHEQVGYDTIRWLNGQDLDQCQLILERDTGFSSGLQKLYAEFYNPSSRTEFALRFGR